MNILKVTTFVIALGLSGSVLAQLVADPWKDRMPETKKINKVSQNTLDKDLPDFVGENTTWNTAMGQDEIAPDVNITNMLLMTQHLRDMGYQIPEGLDTLIDTAPQKLRREIMRSMVELKNSDHPVANISTGLADIFEKNTGLSLENLIMNSLRIIDNRR